MIEASLPSPDTGANGYHLRRVAVKAIQSLDMVAPSYPDGSHPGAAKLAAFFTACATAAADVGKKNQALTFTTAPGTGAIGSQTQLAVGTAGFRGSGPAVGAVTWSSSNTAVATVNGAGLLTRVAAGTATITARAAGDSSTRPGSVTATATVTAA